ncbi:FAD-dependent oxidoreductase [Piscinibacter sp.]|uniref:FAD-dependent oxidoreductase n=1 Tax=Piscinibacter sp. TaxID=1903157 RepID=UPI002C0CCC38|nr:FAD-dependent oxidoreductase [Albitalea sp.]HUG21131.1 FAD-dependent oxidoreductase [Albitalea sp.]
MLAEVRIEIAAVAARPVADAPVVVVGAGPVGVRFAQELRRRCPQQPLVVYGSEPWAPYNRVQLSAFLAGKTDWSSLTQGLALPEDPNADVRLHCAVTAIDRAGRCVQDASGRWQPYASLVLAIGSRARVPDIPGIGQANVFVFRDLNDTQRLFARRARSRRTVVLGGGLLGLEAARAMQRLNTDVWVIEHAPRLMASQLDDEGSALLRAQVEAAGIHVLTDTRVKAVHGHGRVEGVALRGGERVDCDTVVVAAGIQPNVDLAVACGLPVGRGIRVDDAMRTGDPHIYAIGECAEHRGAVYGIVAPGFEQASVAVHSVAGGQAHYEGSLVATRLKVLDLPVFSMGQLGLAGDDAELRSVCHDAGADGTHRRIAVRRGRLVGALAVGACREMSRLQEAVLARRRVMPWQLWRFRRSGSLWPAEEATSVVHWPGAAIVCNCNGVTRAQLGDAMKAGCRSVGELAACTRASTVCGSCKPLLAELAGSGAAPEPVRGWRGLAAVALIAFAFALAIAVLPGLPYMDSVQAAWQWDRLWRDSLYKQVSGFGVLGLTAIGLLLTFRKRIARLRLGHFDTWRFAHVAIGLAVLAVLYVHTGGRLGSQLDGALMVAFTGLILVGGASAAVIAFEHRLAPSLVRRWRSRSVWLHILLFWPVPVLLGFHVLKSYYF